MTETEARAIAAPGSWPWPMSQEARKWVFSVVNDPNSWDDANSWDVPEPAPEFNRAGHDAFMRGLR